MKGYYEKYFPSSFVWNWLSHNEMYPLEKREFRFGENFNIVVNGFKTESAFRDYLSTNQPKGVYIVSGEKSPTFFDVDLDDYILPKGIIDRGVLCSCKEKQCCDICWELIMRRPLLDCLTFLKDFMKFKQVFAMFSGARGFWIFVCDDWTMDRESREFLADRVPAKIDREVTIQPNHLMKVPFSTHRTTGVVCSPIMNPEEFLPSKDTRHHTKIDDVIMKQWVDFIKFIYRA
jgi:DNA primase catalytic subunit